MLSSPTHIARRLLPACVISAAAIAALAAPGVANAERLASCKEGTKVNGEGSTLQETAMKKIWGELSPHAYNAATQKNKKACPGGPEVTYNTKGKTGSGQGMKNWYELEEFGEEAQGFVGTDNPPNEEIEKKIEAVAPGAKVLTIPTLQAAIAIIVHLPTGCTAHSEPGTLPKPSLGRFVLTDKQVEEIFRRKIKTFAQLTKSTSPDNKLAGTGCVPGTEITRVVREDGSGTTATLKKWLELVNGKGETTAGEVCDEAKETWLTCGEEPPKNIKWPEEGVKLIRGNGSGGVVEKVEETPGSIGYVVLANARAGKGKGLGFVPPKGGEGTEEFWVELENGLKEEVGGKKLPVFIDPSTNFEVEAKDRSNCAATSYVAINPATGKAEKGKFPPASTEALWNHVSAEKKEKNYGLCGFTYDLALTKYGATEGKAKAATKAEATTVGDFLEFVLNKEAEGGQTLVEEETDYLGLPESPTESKNVLKIAQKGAEKVQF